MAYVCFMNLKNKKYERIITNTSIELIICNVSVLTFKQLVDIVNYFKRFYIIPKNDQIITFLNIGAYFTIQCVGRL